MEANGTPKRTRADIVCGRLKEDIAKGRFKVGDRLDEVTLANEYGVSRTPIREALSQLVATGEVVRQAHKGCRVAPREAGE